MVTLIVPWSCLGLIVVLVIFAVRGGFWREYPFFYSYLGGVIASDLLRLWSYNYASDFYLEVYWYSQFLSIVLGYGVTWEIYKRTFRDYPGTGRMAECLVTIAFGIVLLNAFVQVLLGQSQALLGSVIDLERNLRMVQAILLILGIGLVLYYEISLGRNLAGLLFGYGLFVCSSVLVLTLRVRFGTDFQSAWQYLQQSAYVITLAIWILTLQSYHPVPTPATEITLEDDYKLLAGHTLQALNRARGHLRKALLP